MAREPSPLKGVQQINATNAFLEGNFQHLQDDPVPKLLMTLYEKVNSEKGLLEPQQLDDVTHVIVIPMETMPVRNTF